MSVSKEMANVITRELGLSSSKIRCIYNPIVDKKFYEKFSESIEYPWYNESVPIILSVGRLDPNPKRFSYSPESLCVSS